MSAHPAPHPMTTSPATATSSTTLGRRDVTDEQFLLTVCGRTVPGLPRVVGLCLVGTVTGVGIVCTGAVVDDDERSAHRHRLALVCGKAVHRSEIGRASCRERV